MSRERRERSAQERERARLERERRRAAREGRPLPPLPEEEPASASHDAPPPVPPVEERPSVAPEPVEAPRHAGEEHGAPPDAPPVLPEPEAAPQPAPPAESPLPHVPRDRTEPPPEPPVPAPPSRAVDPPSPPPWRAAEQPPALRPSRRTVRLPRAAHETGEHEAPIGVRAVGSYEPQPGAPGLPPNRAVQVRRRRRRAGRVLLAGLLLVVAAGGYLGIRLFQPFAGDPGRPVSVTIPEGAGAGDIGAVLAERGVVDSGFLFGIRARLDGGAGLRSGPHELREDMTYSAALAALREAPESAPTVDVTLPEGPSTRENAPRLREAGVRGDYVVAARSADARRRARRLGLPRRARTVEGFLFPATFELRRPARARDLVRKQLEAFADRVGKVDMRAARRANLTRYDVLIVASMVEREALVPAERRTIAGVIYNRLREGMPLGIDATIRYDLGNWSRPLRVSELERDTPYNTRTRRGLPPTPIGNPGDEAIRAAADPREHDFLFYVVKPCGRGAHAFSATDAEFQRDVARYNRARDARGGRDPSRC